jgi:hypothetical protein
MPMAIDEHNMQLLAIDAVTHRDDKGTPKVIALSKWRYTPITLRLYRRIRRALFPGHRLERAARGAREALERCEQIGQCKVD